MGEAFPMNGGDGAFSYTRNSQLQKHGIDSVKGMMQEAITEMLDIQTLASISTTFRIADYGCSVGPNTFYAMENLIQAVETKYSLQGVDSKNVEFQVFFNDNTGNDFNALFASLPLNRKYYATGVPGSFYERVFPRASICLAFSSYSLHWLSKVPEGVWNPGRISYSDSSSDVVKAYSDQFARDMGAFLSARAEEIVKGGQMLLIIPSVTETHSCSHLHLGAMFNLLDSCMMELANEGVINKSEIDALNMPVYFPSFEEMTKMVEKNGCFSVERTEFTKAQPVDAHSFIMHLRAGFQGIFIKHLGASVEENLFAKAFSKTQQLSQLFDSDNYITSQIFFVLKHK